MATDGNLRNIFKDHFPKAHWQPVETWSTGQGVPDAEYCFPGGQTGWIENKCTTGWTVDFKKRETQIAWLERRSRVGGRCFVAIRRQVMAGPRRGLATDELWLFPGSAARQLHLNGLRVAQALGCWDGGPARWSWDLIEKILTR